MRVNLLSTPENPPPEGAPSRSAVMRLVAWWFAVALWKRVLGGFVLGLAVGVFAPNAAAWLEPLGDLFIRGIKLLIVPLVLATLVSGVISLGDIRRMGSLGGWTILVYLCTTLVALLIGVVFGRVFSPGAGLALPADAEAAPPPRDISLVDRFVEMIPTNPFAAMTEGDMLQVIVFALLLGAGILMAAAKGESLARGFASFAEVMLQVTRLVMELAPFGVAALIAVAVAEHGPATIGTLLKLVLVYYAACLAHVVLTYGVIIKALRLKLRRFYRGMIDAQAVAFSTTSSSATLPVTITCVQENLGVGRSTSSFVLPLGATMNMDGTGVYMGIVAAFAAQVAGIHLSAGDYVTLILTATLASIGAAGVPGGSLVMVSTVLLSVGLPLEVFVLLASVDRVIDMARTATNITGDAVAAVFVARRQGDLDEEVYNRLARA